MKTAVVTGGASGIGLEFVKLLISDNYKVYVVDNSQENLSKLSSIVNSENFESILQDLSTIDLIKLIICPKTISTTDLVLL